MTVHSFDKSGISVFWQVREMCKLTMEAVFTKTKNGWKSGACIEFEYHSRKISLKSKNKGCLGRLKKEVENGCHAYESYEDGNTVVLPAVFKK